jgi:hypothetical protein
METLGIQVTDVSATGLALLAVNVLITVATAIIAFSLRRLVAQNDKDHAAIQAAQDRERERIDGQIGKFMEAINSERDARQNGADEIGNRVWDIRTDLGEHYAKQEMVLRLFGSLSQKLSAQHGEVMKKIETDVMKKIDELPCRRVECPGGPEQGK